MIDRQKCAVEAGMVSRSSAPSSGGSLPSVRHLTHHPYTAEDSIQPDGRNCKEKIIVRICQSAVDYKPQHDV